MTATKTEPFLEQLAAIARLTPAETEARARRCNGDQYALVRTLAHDAPHLKEALGKLWGDQLGVAYVNLQTSIVHPDTLQKIPRDFALRYGVLPLYEFDDVVTIATATPGDPDLEHRIQNTLHLFISQVFSFPEEIQEAIAIHYQTRDELSALLKAVTLEDGSLSQEMVTVEQLRRQAGDEYIIKFAQGLLMLALSQRASDIHIEPRDLHLSIRFRIDGLLQEQLTLDPQLLNALVSRLKILAGADISERRKPQDGRIKLELPSRVVDLRFSTVPTIYGEKVVLRILGQNTMKGVPDLATLDLSVSVREKIAMVSHSPNGVFFVTGPTGSGKTTTLYSILKSINQPDINIMTIEDPVEYRLEGLNQIQVNPTIGLDFSTALRAFLRQDPDVILIGEIRDVASAKIASQAALTGHLVFATLHTNNCLQAVSRMIEIGVEPFLVAPSLIALMAQRLVRRICPHCKESYAAAAAEITDNFTGDPPAEPLRLYRGAGCARCNQTGYTGRLAVHEIFVVTPEVRKLISDGASIMQIETQARVQGFKPLRYDGLKKAIRGLTTLREVDRITYTSE